MGHLIDEEAQKMLRKLQKLMEPGKHYIAAVVEVPHPDNEWGTDGGMLCYASNVKGSAVAIGYGTIIGKLMNAVDSSAILMNRQDPGSGDEWKMRVVQVINSTLDEADVDDQTIHIKRGREE